ncbi:hypothetical protein JTE90_018855 [Oedothorax gibbosus]|uniref:Reverse transcriptase domain-containing protein n=1 Tax=Oedothorax gibbosus TaxID=931172 RepID=A0AAV6TVW7_9ARAC|nr:hypothetical protein JTE90_018855 [Oedothorax gibbosus]
MPVGSDYGDVYINLINRHFSVTDVASRDRVQYNDPAMPVIGHAELGRAINSQKGSRAPGPDGINPAIVKLLYSRIPDLFLGLFNSLLRFSSCPGVWKFAIVIFFGKRGKPVELAQSYRPVCLLQSLSKVLEKIINNRLIFYLERNSAIHNRQYGFRERRGTTHCLNDVISCVKTRNIRYKHTVMVVFDFAGAFDCANWRIIFDKLAESAVDPYLINIACSYLNNRGVGFRDGDTWVRFNIDRGCPQGS